MTARTSEEVLVARSDERKESNNQGIRCFLCRRRGHVAKDCRSRKTAKDSKKGSSPSPVQSGSSHLADEESLCSMGESFFSGLGQVRSSFSKESSSGREAHATGRKRHGSSKKGAGITCRGETRSKPCRSPPLDRVPPDGNDVEKTCVGVAFAQEN